MLGVRPVSPTSCVVFGVSWSTMTELLTPVTWYSTRTADAGVVRLSQTEKRDIVA